MSFWIRTTRILFAYDSLCYGAVKGLLCWLEEWLSVSQQLAERIMIAVYSGTMIAGSGFHTSQAAGMNALCQIMVCMLMYNLHRKPAAMREYSSHSEFSKVGRLFIQAMMLSLVLLDLLITPLHWYDLLRALGAIDYLVFFYSIDITSTGIRGRRRKLALSELKRLFGDVGWIPKPATAEVA